MKIIGTKAKDNLVGTTGVDFINGKRGADVLVSNGGDDVMKGGKGADTFVFFASPEASLDLSLILDFQPNKDSILIVAEGFEANVAQRYDEQTGVVSINYGGDTDTDGIVQITSGLYLHSGDILVG